MKGEEAVYTGVVFIHITQPYLDYKLTTIPLIIGSTTLKDGITINLI